MNIFADLSAVAGVLIMSMVLIGLVVALNHNNRRTAGLPHAPFGADVDDTDLARIRCELANAHAHAA